MDELSKARKTIDAIDEQFARLFEQRMKAVKELASFKAEHSLPVFDESRENELLIKNASLITDDEIKSYFIAFQRSLMELSKRFQYNYFEALKALDFNEKKANIIPVYSESGIYNIHIERGSLKRISSIIRPSGRVLIVSDSGVPFEYISTVSSAFGGCPVFLFEDGEQGKSFETLKAICERLLCEGFGRNDSVVALGGGVVGDVVGFSASCYMRGIDFYNIPTTLLSQLDSSIGGKTAINLYGVKNIVGSFFQPKAVVIDPDVLDTLPERHFSNGLAEALKTGIIGDKKLFELCENVNVKECIDEIIVRSILFKKSIVELDEKESGLRKCLNFGHTVGHAIEATVEPDSLLHGECVGLGMLPMCSAEIRSRVIAALKNCGLPVKYDCDKEKVFAALFHDKKTTGNKITLVKSKKIGSFYFDETETERLKEYL